MKNIVIIANPFGYGPAGKAIAIAEAFVRSGYPSVILAGSGFSLEIVPDSITTICVDERDELAITKMLSQISDPVVISSQNRFAVKAAKSLGLPSAFLDGLAWFWQEIPADHLIADDIFWMDYPHITESLPATTANIHIVPAIVDVIPSAHTRDQVLIHIGGCKNPLSDAFPKYYLSLLAESLAHVAEENILIAGGMEVITFLGSLLEGQKNRIRTASLKHPEFIAELSKSKHFITTAGQTATLEAFGIGIPTSFLLPMNNSQLALTSVLAEYNAAPQTLTWQTYLPHIIDLSTLDEKTAINELGRYAQELYEDTQLRHRLELDLTKTILTLPATTGQAAFIGRLGTNGAEVIRDILTKKWL